MWRHLLFSERWLSSRVLSASTEQRSLSKQRVDVKLGYGFQSNADITYSLNPEGLDEMISKVMESRKVQNFQNKHLTIQMDRDLTEVLINSNSESSEFFKLYNYNYSH